MVRVFSNDPTAFLQEEHPVDAWNEMLSLEEKATFREVMSCLAQPHRVGEGPTERLDQEVILSLDFEFTKIVQVLRYLPTDRQLERVNRRLQDYESFLSDCIHKMHSQLNEFDPKLETQLEGWGSLEEEQSLRVHTRLKGFEERLMQKIGNLAQQIRKLSDCFQRLDQMRRSGKPFWTRWFLRLLAPLMPSGLVLSEALMRRLEIMQHKLVQDYARLGTLWRYYNQHRVLRTLEAGHQGRILEVCKLAYWRENLSTWESPRLEAYLKEALPALGAYEKALEERWAELAELIPRALCEGIEGDIESLQLEAEDLTITLGKYKEVYGKLHPAQNRDLPDGFQQVEVLSRGLHQLSADVHKARANLHTILNELGRESKENVLVFVAWSKALPELSYEAKQLEPQLKVLFEAVEDYIEAIKAEVQDLASARNWEARHRKKAEAFRLEITDIQQVVRTFRAAYKTLRQEDPDARELFDASTADLNTSRLDTMIERLGQCFSKLEKS